MHDPRPPHSISYTYVTDSSTSNRTHTTRRRPAAPCAPHSRWERQSHQRALVAGAAFNNRLQCENAFAGRCVAPRRSLNVHGVGPAYLSQAAERTLNAKGHERARVCVCGGVP